MLIEGQQHPATSTAPVLIGSGLSHEFVAGSPLFVDLDFRFESGDLIALVGPSGSGKSTLLSIIANWLRPTAGKVTTERVRHIGWVFQNPHGVARRTAHDHVSLPLLAQGMTRRAAGARAREILDVFNLTEVAGLPFKALSGGEAQRLMLARAVAVAPDVLLVDEPTAQLDMHTAATVNAVLAQIAQDNCIVVVATHDPNTRDACHRVIDLADFQRDDLSLSDDGSSAQEVSAP